MKLKLLTFLMLSAYFGAQNRNVGINTVTPDKSAILEISACMSSKEFGLFIR